jgi:hypothetical protein
LKDLRLLAVVLIPPEQTETSFPLYCYQCTDFAVMNHQEIVAHIFVAKYGASG